MRSLMPAVAVTRAVIDSNVIVSSAISEKGASRRVLEAWHTGDFTLLTCTKQITEVSRALRYDRIRLRYHLADEDIRSILALLWTQAEIASDPPEVLPVTGDPGDDLLLALCKATSAAYFVTGDGPLLNLVRHGPASIVSPRVFADLIAQGA